MSSYKTFFAELVVSAVEKLDTHLLDKELIGIKEVTGGSISDSFLVNGVAFQKTTASTKTHVEPRRPLSIGNTSFSTTLAPVNAATPM